ncbi:hypothetical protein FLAVO9AF_800051 [Flavobacterium sp. 9AF]|nr:hypothetical protein FLAVO9AF_800051 [Flavobacterium sp. 9AF]
MIYKIKLPIIIKKIQSAEITEKNFHEIESNSLQTNKHLAREIYPRQSFFPEKK